MRVVRLASLVLIPLVVAATSFGALLIAGRALAPIAGIAATLESIQATDLGRRVSARGLQLLQFPVLLAR